MAGNAAYIWLSKCYIDALDFPAKVPMTPVYASEEFTRTFLRHFVSFMCVASGESILRKTGKPNTFLHFSGFVVEHGDDWAVITAGHIFGDYLKELADEGVTFSYWQLDDSAVSGTPQPPNVFPLDLKSEVLFFNHGNMPGMDYAVFKLPALVRMGAQQQGIVPIRKEQWSTDALGEFATWILVGVPDQTVKAQIDASVHEKHIVCVKLDRVHSRPSGFADTPFERLYATIDFSSIGDNGPRITDIAGMSGGPIFGLQGTHDNFKYRLIGVQSSWNKQDSVAICAAQPFIDALETTMTKQPPLPNQATATQEVVAPGATMDEMPDSIRAPKMG